MQITKYNLFSKQLRARHIPRTGQVYSLKNYFNKAEILSFAKMKETGKIQLEKPLAPA